MNIATPFHLSLASQLDATSGTKNATGLLHDWETLTDENNLRAFRKTLDKVICFFALDSNSSEELIQYVSQDGLRATSSDAILCLYLSNYHVSQPTVLGESEIQALIDVKTDINLSQYILASHFEDKSFFKLPGILVFDIDPDSDDCMFIQITPANGVDDKKQHYHQQINTIFDVVINSKHNRSGFLAKIGSRLSLNKISYVKSNRISFREWVNKLARLAYDLKGDIISIVT